MFFRSRSHKKVAQQQQMCFSTFEGKKKQIFRENLKTIKKNIVKLKPCFISTMLNRNQVRVEYYFPCGTKES